MKGVLMVLCKDCCMVSGQGTFDRVGGRIELKTVGLDALPTYRNVSFWISDL